MPFPIRLYASDAVSPHHVTPHWPAVQSGNRADLAHRIETVGNDVRRALAQSDRLYHSRNDAHGGSGPTRRRRAVPPQASPTVAPSCASPASHHESVIDTVIDNGSHVDNDGDSGVVRTKHHQTTFFRPYQNVSMVLKSVAKAATPFRSLVEVGRDFAYLWRGDHGHDDDYRTALHIAEGADAAVGLIPQVFIMQLVFDLPRRLADGLDGKEIDIEEAFGDIQNIVMLRDMLKNDQLVVRTRRQGAASGKWDRDISGKPSLERAYRAWAAVSSM